MIWTEGHYWKALIPFSELVNEFAYKYVIRDNKSKAIRKWEAGTNRSFNLITIQNYLLSPERMYSVKMAEKYKFSIAGSKFIYDQKRNCLNIIDTWQI